jgi:hypothetical protein
MTTDPEEHELTLVKSCGTDGEAEVIVTYLKANGIDAAIESDLPPSMYPDLSDAQVYVNKSDAKEALRLLEGQGDLGSTEPQA